MDQITKEDAARIAMGMHGISLSTIGATMTTVSGVANPDQLRMLSDMVRDVSSDLVKLSDILCGGVADEIIEKSKGFKP